MNFSSDNVQFRFLNKINTTNKENTVNIRNTMKISIINAKLIQYPQYNMYKTMY